MRVQHLIQASITAILVLGISPAWAEPSDTGPELTASAGEPGDPSGTPDAAPSNVVENSAARFTYESNSALASGVVATIDGVPIPYDWFLHEFRSIATPQPGQADPRAEVFDAFLRKMTLFARARKEGILDDPRLRSQIDERVAATRAYMEYQLAMIEVNAAVQAYLTLMGITPDAFSVGDQDVDQKLEQVWAGRTGDAEVPAEIPEAVRESVRRQLMRERFEQAVREHLDLMKEDLAIEVNEALVNDVPFPRVIDAGPAPD